ncbi:methyltransferase domain-containing protein [Actinoallomurus purpureus]|uniref:methyltransferase domain-containing protein n=1 Tax=Actinoallomurus purpureus TaxID=478114 RepID=UPI0020922DCA|nr:methyltransferase domain-containing protein [Actinoallomurus purpureus]MCO6010833.1 methyltransferase domain-containing protein [Actinoallomurus purpureus]
MNAQEALTAVPREPFVPDQIFVRDEHGWLVPLRRTDDPERWREQVAADDAIVTRTAFDPAIPRELCDATTGRGVEATSSSSAPYIMARVIDALELRPGMRVLEIGTGTGYNAAVLAHLLGPENVISIEIDEVAAQHARRALEVAGYPVQVITGNGEEGHPQGAPYDRIVATASAHTVPIAWVEQVRPAGMILVPWAPTFHPDWPLCRLIVRPGGIAEGRFVGPSPFMPLRDQPVTPRAMQEAEERWIEAGRPDCTRYGVTVTPAGQHVWLDSPGNPIAS